MNKIGYIFSLLLIFVMSAEGKSLLYKVSSSTSTVYVLGSIHLAKPELYPLNSEIIKAYKDSDVLVVEIDTESGASVEAMQSTMSSSGIYKEGKSLKTELSKKTYAALKVYADKKALPLNMMEQMQPWLVMLQLSITEMIRLGYDPELGIDKHFLTKAKQDGKEIIELETAQEQMALLSRNDKLFQDKLLRYTLESMREMEPMLEKMFKSWKNGDVKTLDAIISSPLDDDPSLKEVYEELITKRNYKMTQKIESFLKTKKNYLVVVGSGHVIGKEGIVNLLDKHGYRVMQR